MNPVLDGLKTAANKISTRLGGNALFSTSTLMGPMPGPDPSAIAALTSIYVSATNAIGAAVMPVLRKINTQIMQVFFGARYKRTLVSLKSDFKRAYADLMTSFKGLFSSRAAAGSGVFSSLLTSAKSVFSSIGREFNKLHMKMMNRG